MARRRMLNPAIFICDIQEKFRPVIHEYPKVIATAQKMIKARFLSGTILSIPTFATTQSSSRLGPLCAELLLPSTTPIFDKTVFSMLTPALRYALQTISPSPFQIALVGIEAHICVSQTALDLIAEGHRVYVIADGVSSCHEGEIAVALRRLGREGVVVTTSEAWLYECMGDARIPEFKAIAGLVKETKETTGEALSALCKF